MVIASHDLALLERHCDEVVVLEDGEVVDRGDPHAVLQQYRRRLIDQGRAPRRRPRSIRLRVTGTSEPRWWS